MECGGVASDKVVAEAGVRGDADARAGRNLFKHNSPEFRWSVGPQGPPSSHAFHH